MASTPHPTNQPHPTGKLDFTSGAHGEPEVWLPRLQRLLADQLALTAELNAIDARKAAALGVCDMETYLTTLEERQPVIDAMTALNEDLKPFADRFAVLATGLKDEQREAVFAQAGKLDAALLAITQRDSIESGVLAERRDEIARELANIRNGRAALGAYGPVTDGPMPQCHDEQV
ncbi:MAG: hypothetical protein Q8L55_03200 [Phycisphaerales bacterium]|nr:hypothetical protein [Phycisphaerales bacterium]